MFGLSTSPCCPQVLLESLNPSFKGLEKRLDEAGSRLALVDRAPPGITGREPADELGDCRFSAFLRINIGHGKGIVTEPSALRLRSLFDRLTMNGKRLSMSE